VLKSYIKVAKEFVDEKGEPTIDGSVEIFLRMKNEAGSPAEVMRET